MASKVIEKLAETYQVLYLDPDATEQEEYEKVLLKGQPAPATDLGHFIGDDRDVHDTVDTPAGPVEVITLYNRSDFEVFVRCMMAAKDGPKRQVPKTTGASTLVTFNWDKIRANRDDYKETIIVLSVGPYSNVPAEEVGLEPDEWAEKSYLIRKFHECNHFICRKLFPDQIEAVWDELVAYAVERGRKKSRLHSVFMQGCTAFSIRSPSIRLAVRMLFLGNRAAIRNESKYDKM